MNDTLKITPYERQYRRPALDLVYHASRVFTHLDWHDAGQWLDTPYTTIFCVWRHSTLVGIMGTAQPLMGTTWIRLAALDDREDGYEAIQQLWKTLCDHLAKANVTQVAVLVIDRWFEDYLPVMGFSYDQDIITFSRNAYTIPEPPPNNLAIRPAYLEDLPRMTAIDQTAFKPPWQLSLMDLRQARRISALCTVGLLDGEIVGYQLSTLYQQSGHLARLAVLPDLHGQGIGSTLVIDLIQRFNNKSVYTITVNTQARNTKSQRVYTRYGFIRNGYDLPVWLAALNPSDSSAINVNEYDRHLF